jgi:hypothetical protein
MRTLRAAFPRLVLTLLVAAVAVWLAFNRDRLDPALIETAMHGLGLWAPLGHIVLFALATILFVPGAIFGLLGGVLFGPFWGTALNLAGATLGATAAFLVARYVAADWVRRKASGRLDLLITGVEAEGWRFVAFVRLVPLFPFQPHQLRAWPHAHFLKALCPCIACLHGAGHAGLHLARPCRPRGRRRQHRRDPLRPDRRCAAGRNRVPATAAAASSCASSRSSANGQLTPAAWARLR